MIDKKKSFQVKSEGQLTFKIVILGSSSVGKTSIMRRYLNNEFAMKSMSTVGVACESKIVTIQGHQVKVQLWDTAGQERFRSLTKNYYRGSDGVIVVYDISNKNTFDQADGWIQDFDEKCDKSAVKMLIGNKIDLPRREVHQQQGTNYAQKKKFIFGEVSAKENINIENMMILLIESIIQNRSVQQQTAPRIGRRNSLNEKMTIESSAVMNNSLTVKSTFSSLNLWRTTIPQKSDVRSNEHSELEKDEHLKSIESLEAAPQIIVTNPENEQQVLVGRESFKLSKSIEQLTKQQQFQQQQGCICQNC